MFLHRRGDVALARLQWRRVKRHGQAPMRAWLVVCAALALAPCRATAAAAAHAHRTHPPYPPHAQHPTDPQRLERIKSQILAKVNTHRHINQRQLILLLVLVLINESPIKYFTKVLGVNFILEKIMKIRYFIRYISSVEYNE